MDSPKIIGVVNMTEDSFSDGGHYLAAEDAIAHARKLLDDGADVIDLGPASSHPDAREVSPEEEIARLCPVISALHGAGADIRLSVDSYRSETQRFAIEQGVAYLNDIQGFSDPSLYEELARSSCRLILMHSIQRGGSATREASEPSRILDEIDDFFERRLDTLSGAGIVRERIILDPGMGFFLGDDPEASIRVLQNIERLRDRWKCPILISVSRKSFLGAITDRAIPDRGAATLTAELHAARHGVSYIRTHDVAALRDALRVRARLEPS